MKKIIFLVLNLIILSGCVQSTAMIGPAITAASTGNFLQAGFSYGTNLTKKETTGKNTSEHIVDYKKKKRIEKNLKNLLKEHIKVTRKKILLTTKN